MKKLTREQITINKIYLDENLLKLEVKDIYINGCEATIVKFDELLDPFNQYPATNQLTDIDSFCEMVVGRW